MNDNQIEILAKCNRILGLVELKMMPNVNECGENFHDIVSVRDETVKLGQQSIHENENSSEMEDSIIRWISNYRFNEGYLRGRGTTPKSDTEIDRLRRELAEVKSELGWMKNPDRPYL